MNAHPNSEISAVVSNDVSTISYYASIQVQKGLRKEGTRLEMQLPAGSALLMVADEFSIENRTHDGKQIATMWSSLPANKRTGVQTINLIITSPMPALWDEATFTRPKIIRCNYPVAPIAPFEYLSSQPQY